MCTVGPLKERHKKTPTSNQDLYVADVDFNLVLGAGFITARLRSDKNVLSAAPFFKKMLIEPVGIDDPRFQTCVEESILLLTGAKAMSTKQERRRRWLEKIRNK